MVKILWVSFLCWRHNQKVRKLKLLAAAVLLLSASALAQCTPTKVEALAHAIARAEGFYVKGSLPNRLHNPGDIRALPGTMYIGQLGMDKNRYVIFATDAFGFVALERQLQKIADGKTAHYRLDMSFAAFGRKYVGGEGWVQWVKIVTQRLGISPATTLREYFEGETATS